MTRIWDFRRGDDDDNRMSPHASSLRSVILSAALEFNFLKAAIVFLALIIGPALLVGAAPSIVVTYGRLMLHAKAMAGTNLLPGLALLVILLAIALWVGRRFVIAAFDNFRHLHYTLVFVYVSGWSYRCQFVRGRD